MLHHLRQPARAQGDTQESHQQEGSRTLLCPEHISVNGGKSGALSKWDDLGLVHCHRLRRLLLLMLQQFLHSTADQVTQFTWLLSAA